MIKVKLCLSVPTFVYSRLTEIFQPLESASSDVIRRGKSKVGKLLCSRNDMERDELRVHFVICSY